MVPEFLGHPMVTGEAMTATAKSDLFFRWTPGVNAFFMRIQHPIPGMDPEISPEAEFAGYPPAQSPQGVLVADDTTNRFIAAIDGFRDAAWHQHVGFTLGIPASSGAAIFSGAGGPAATRGIVALTSDGHPKWMFSPSGLTGERQRIVARPATKTIYIPLNTEIPTGSAAQSSFGAASADPKEGLVTAGNTRPETRRQTGNGGYVRQDRVPPNTRPRFGRETRNVPGEIPETRPVTIRGSVPGPMSDVGHGHWMNPGLVLTNGKVFGEVEGSIVALDQESGSVAWRKPLDDGFFVTSMVASPEYLVCCVCKMDKGGRAPYWEIGKADTQLVAYRLDNGKRSWVETVDRPGVLSMSDGMLFLANGDLHAYGPAERTFHMVVDSSRKVDYKPYRDPNPDTAMVAQSCGPAEKPTDDEPEAKSDPNARREDVADATLLRLTWDDTTTGMRKKADERRIASFGVPMLLALDWLDSTRANRLREAGNKPWSSAEIEDFAQTCGELAASQRPDRFDVAPEVNVYLARYPDQIASIRALVTAAAAAVHKASPETKVCVSFNTEVFLGYYAKGTYLPFGKVTPPDRPDRGELLSLVPLVDEVALTSYPQTAFADAASIPRGYFHRARAWFPDKPVLISGIGVRCDPKEPRSLDDQKSILKTLMGGLYWLNAQFVAYPELIGATEDEKSALALRIGDEDRPALKVWQGWQASTLVKQLTLLVDIGGGIRDQPVEAAPAIPAPGAPQQ